VITSHIGLNSSPADRQGPSRAAPRVVYVREAHVAGFSPNIQARNDKRVQATRRLRVSSPLPDITVESGSRRLSALLGVAPAACSAGRLYQTFDGAWTFMFRFWKPFRGFI
jgi:hypothetical protein